MARPKTSERPTRPSADATRERVLAAALDVFSERGFDGASTREIATRAGVTQPLLNYHFSSKDDLWRAAVDELFGQLVEVMTARQDGLRGVEEPMDYLVDRHVRPMYDETTALIASLVEQGHMADIAPPHLYYIITGAGPSMFVLAPECRRLSGLDPTSDDVIEAHAEAVCALLFTGPA
jgi:TetR/AcrR family transcriptional regulator